MHRVQLCDAHQALSGGRLVSHLHHVRGLCPGSGASGQEAQVCLRARVPGPRRGSCDCARHLWAALKVGDLAVVACNPELHDSGACMRACVHQCMRAYAHMHVHAPGHRPSADASCCACMVLSLVRSMAIHVSQHGDDTSLCSVPLN